MLQVHKHPAIRPQPGQAAADRRRGRERLHQRQLRARLQLEEGVHSDAGPAALHEGRLLADVLGDQLKGHRHADPVYREGSGEVRPLLAVRHGSRLLWGHPGDHPERVALPRLEHQRVPNDARGHRSNH